MVLDYEDEYDDSNNTKLSVSERLPFDILNNLNLGRYSHWPGWGMPTFQPSFFADSVKELH